MAEPPHPDSQPSLRYLFKARLLLCEVYETSRRWDFQGLPGPPFHRPRRFLKKSTTMAPKNIATTTPRLEIHRIASCMVFNAYTLKCWWFTSFGWKKEATTGFGVFCMLGTASLWKSSFDWTWSDMYGFQAMYRHSSCIWIAIPCKT